MIEYTSEIKQTSMCNPGNPSCETRAQSAQHSQRREPRKRLVFNSGQVVVVEVPKATQSASKTEQKSNKTSTHTHTHTHTHATSGAQSAKACEVAKRTVFDRVDNIVGQISERSREQNVGPSVPSGDTKILQRSCTDGRAPVSFRRAHADLSAGLEKCAFVF